MNIDEPAGPRFEAALDLFAEGEPLVFNQVAFELREGVLRCEALSTWQPAATSAALVKRDHARAVETFEHLREVNPRFRELTTGRDLTWHVIDDYGKGSVEIAQIIGDKVVWVRGMERPTSLQRAIDRALPIVDDRLLRHPGPPLDRIREALVDAREQPHSAEPPLLLSSLGRLLVDGYPDLTDHELSEAIDWVERAAAAQRADDD